jgi:zinc/manganese transport system substrate-binding protein
VQNGVGYDDFMDKIESASPSASRTVIDVQKLLGLPDSTPNPHLWYKPTTMPAVARALVSDLSALQPAHAAYFRANERRFNASLQPWLVALLAFRIRHPGTTVATTEPVSDYMLEAAGIRDVTPFSMQADIMNGTDPAPQAVTQQNAVLAGHRVMVFVYNRQVTDTVTQNFLKAATNAGVPVVGVYETMPTPGYTYQSWMMAELQAIERAVTHRTSTESLGVR